MARKSTAGRKLSTHVTVTNPENGRSETFGPDDELPDWFAGEVTNPDVWEGSEGEQPEADPADQGEQPDVKK